MIGCRHGHNDISVFFEGDEIQRLKTERVHGVYLNFNPSYKGELEAVVDEKIPFIEDLTKTEIQKNPEGVILKLIVLMKPRVYEAVLERGHYEDHQGWRHVFLLDAVRLRSQDEIFYNTLRIELERYARKGVG